MSGGSYDYIYSKIDDLATEIPDRDNPHRTAFKKLLHLVASAVHDIEWVDSCDTAPGDENAAINKVFCALQVDPRDVYKVAAFDRIKKLVEGVG